MSADETVACNRKEETVRTERVSKAWLSDEVVSLSIGGEVRLSHLMDAEEYVGEVAPKNDVRIVERSKHFLITVYRTKRICENSSCRATAESKFDGTWLCQSHLSSYAAQYI